MLTIYFKNFNLIFFSLLVSLRENCPNTEFFLVCIFPHLDRIQENTDHKKLRIWTFFTQCLCHFTEKKFFWNFCTLTLFLMRRMLGWNSFLNIFFFIKVTSLLNIFSPYMPDYLRGHRVYEKVTYSVLLSIIFLLSANVVLLPQVSLFEKRDFPVSQNCCLKQLIRLKLSKKKTFSFFFIQSTYNFLLIICFELIPYIINFDLGHIKKHRLFTYMWYILKYFSCLRFTKNVKVLYTKWKLKAYKFTGL